MSRRRTSKIGLLCAIVTMVAVCGSALAFFSAKGAGTAAAVVTQLTAPTITAATPAAGTVSLTWKAVTAPGGGTVEYYVTRNGAEEPEGTCPGEAEPKASTTSCVDKGLPAGSYEYTVTAVFGTWTKTSAVATAKVTVGAMTKFAITGSTAAPAAGASVNLTITAEDAHGATVSTFTGSHSLIFAGAAKSPGGTAPSVVNTGGSTIAFGAATALTFTAGVASVASSRNGVLKVYAAGEAEITATEGSFTTPEPLELEVSPLAATKYTLTAASATPTAGEGDNLTVTAVDTYGNTATGYTGSHSLVFSGAAASPGGTAATVDDSSGKAVAFGAATPIAFTKGVAAVSAGGNGEMRIYKSGAASIKATEGTITNATVLAVAVAAAPAASLTLTAATTTPVAAASDSLTTTAKDAYGNTATAYTGAKSLTFAGAEASPSGALPTVVSSVGTVVNFGMATPITFTNGVATVASSQNGVLKLNKAGATSVTATDGTLTTAPLAFTVAVGTAKKVALSGLTATAGVIGSPCFFTCAVTTLGNAGKVSSKLAITDEVGNTVSNLGAGKTVKVTASGTAGSTILGSPVALPTTGLAVTAAAFTYTAPASGAYANTITLASTGYTSATVTAAK